METKPGRIATVYESKVAPIEQGPYTAQGGATQLVVPDLSKFSIPRPIPGKIIPAAESVQPRGPSSNVLVPGAIAPTSMIERKP